jgi:putative mRNA 3-end processing factor
MVDFTPVCGGAELGATGYLLEHDDRSILLDCGIGGGTGLTWLDDLPEDLDACWLSHAHLDHAGSVPALVGDDPLLDCYATPGTKAMAELTLKTVPEIPYHQAAAIGDEIDAIEPMTYQSLPTLEDPTAAFPRLMPFPAGHVLGAAMVSAEFQDDDGETTRIFYTGDFCSHDQVVTPGARFPQVDDDFSIDALVMEGVLSTNKEADDIDYDREVERLVDMFSADGPRVLGLSTTGEAAEVAGALSEADLDFVVHDYLEPVLEVYAETYPDALPLDAFEFRDTSETRDRVLAGGLALAPGDQFQVGSPAGKCAREIYDDPSARLAVLNRAHASEPIGRMLEAEPGQKLELYGLWRPVEATAERFVLPSHAPRWGLIGAVEALQPDRVVLVHGRESRLYALRRALEKHGYEGPIDIPENGETLEIG